MSRYIDADEVKEALTRWGVEPPDLGIKYTIDRIPTADVVPVVRCKDCKYYRESKNPERSGIKFCYRLKHPTEDRSIGYNYSDDDFCSRGERKEE